MPFDSQPYSDALQLKNLPAKGPPPKSRLNSARRANEIFWLLYYAALPRLTKATVMQQMFDGNPPYNQTKLRNSGQSWRANFNTLEGTARKEAGKTPFYDLFSSSQTYFEILTEHATASMDADDASRIITEEFDLMLRSWPSLDIKFWRMLDDFIAFNKGFFWWPRQDDWHFKHVPWNQVYFPDGTSIDPDDWELFAIEHRFPLTRLFQMISDESVARAAGWNVDAVGKAIRRASPVYRNLDDPMEWQRRIRDWEHDPSFLSSVVHCASIYFREFGGKWGRMLVALHQAGSSSGGKPASMVEASNEEGADANLSTGDTDWLFYKPEVAESVYELMTPFIFEVGSDTINTLDGMGKRILSVMQLKDRMRCEQANAVLLRTTLLLQAQNASTSSKVGLVQIGGGITTIPAGYNALQSTMLGDIEPTLAVNRDLDLMLDVNTGVYRPQFEKPQGNPETATAAQLRFGQATVLTNSAVLRFYAQFDKMGVELFRRATLPDLPNIRIPGIQEARKFQERCRKRGVSDRQLRDVLWVRATRSIGNGSPIMRQQQISGISTVVPFLGQRGVQNWLEDFIAAWGGQTKVDRYMPLADRRQEPSKDDWEASRENNDMQQGAPPLLVEGQNHEIHAARHIQGGMEAIQAVQQGADPTSAALFLQMAIPHIPEHLQRIGRETNRKQLEQAFKQMQEGATIVEQAVKERQQQAQQQQQLTFEQNLKSQETAAKLAERQTKLEQQMGQKEAKFEQDQRLETARTLSEIERQTAKTQADIEATRAKTAAATAKSISKDK
jgi:hypothetical protein